MHKHEISIAEQGVQELIAKQFPQYTNLPIKKITTSGTDHTLFRLGEKLCVRLPRTPEAASTTQKEQTWLPKLAPHLSLTIPKVIAAGRPSKQFAHAWSVYEWIEGETLFHAQVDNLEQAAQNLGTFIRELQKIETTGAPETRRGKPLATQDQAVREALKALEAEIDTTLAAAIWKECLSAPTWQEDPVWLHADLLPSNLLTHNNKLSAVIDFGLCGVGDPAVDLIPAWSIFSGTSRELFKRYTHVDEATWKRGKGWALSIALIIIPYYRDTNPELVAVARHIIANITQPNAT